MSTFRRMRDALRANLNELLERAADREGGLRGVTREIEDALRAARAELAGAGAHIAEIERDWARARDAAAAAERAAMDALRLKNEHVAREHLQRKLQREAEARDLGALVAREKTYLAELRDTVTALERRLEVVRAHAAAQQAATRTEAADEQWKGYAGRVDWLEAEAEALRELWRDLRRDEPPAPPVRDELRDLKDRLDKK
jgi:phage shock protein A